MRKALFWTLTICLLVGMIGCGEDEEEEKAKEPAKLLLTEPINGGEMSANGSLIVTFDMAVTEVKVNGVHAEVAGSSATWRGQGLQVGEQAFRIEWTDENGNSGSQDITLIVEVPDTTPPEVSEVNVKSGTTDVDAGKLNDEGIIIKFSERIDTGRSKDAFVLLLQGSPIVWTPQWSDGDTQVTLEPGPKTKLRPGSEYTLTISGYFDGAGNEGGPMEINFATAGVSLPTEDLKLWLMADKGVELNGSSVTLWQDQSGNGADAEQGSAANQPTLDENAINGLPALSFDGVDDFLTFTLPIDGLSGMTIFVVSAATQDIEIPFPHCQYAAIFWNETASWGTAHVTPLQNAVWIRFGTGQTQTIPVVYRYNTPVGEDFTVVAATMEGITDYLYVNGELVLTNEKPAGQDTIANQRDLGNIGRGYNDDTYFPGMIAEVLVYTKTLSDTERQDAEKYLSDKYSIKR